MRNPAMSRKKDLTQKPDANPVEKTPVFRNLCAVYGASPIPTVILSPDDRILMLNEAMEHLVGRKADELLTIEKAGELLLPDPDYREKILALSRESRDHGTDLSRTVIELVSKDGETRQIELASYDVDADNGEMLRVTQAIDITDRHAAEVRLREIERQFSLLNTFVTDVIWTMDTELCFTYASASAKALFGIPTGKLERMSAKNIFPSGTIERFRMFLENEHQPAADDQDREPSLMFEAKIEREREGTVIVEHRLALMYDETEGTVIGILGVTRDITERSRTEVELRNSENRFRSLVSTAPVGIVLTDGDGVIQVANNAYAGLFGLLVEEVTGNNFFAQIPVVERQTRASGMFRFLLDHNTLPPQEVTVINRHGLEVPVEITGTVLRDREGYASNFIFVTRDITERRIAEEAVRTSENTFRDLVENLNEIIYTIDSDGIITYISTPVCDILGFEPGEMTGRDFTDFMHPDDLAHSRKKFEEIRHGDVSQNQYRLRKKNGKYIWVLTSSRPVEFEDSSKGLQGSLMDISERKRVEESLRESEERYRLFVEHFQGIAFSIRPDFSPIFLHGDVENITGYTAEEIMSGSVVWENIMHPDDIPRSRMDIAPIEEYVGATCETEYRIIRKDGLIRWLYQLLMSVEDKGSDGVIYVGTLYDLTQMVETREKLRDARSELELKTRNLEETNTALNVLLKHQDDEKKEMEKKIVNNLDTLVSPYLEKIRQVSSDERVNTFINIIRTNIEEMTRPMADVLSSYYSKLTPTEIQIVNMIRENKSTAEMAEMLFVSEATIFFHRRNIREKLGLKNKRVNLKSFIQSLS